MLFNLTETEESAIAEANEAAAEIVGVLCAFLNKMYELERKVKGTASMREQFLGIFDSARIGAEYGWDLGMGLRRAWEANQRFYAGKGYFGRMLKELRYVGHNTEKEIRRGLKDMVAEEIETHHEEILGKVRDVQEQMEVLRRRMDRHLDADCDRAAEFRIQQMKLDDKLRHVARTAQSAFDTARNLSEANRTPVPKTNGKSLNRTRSAVHASA